MITQETTITQTVRDLRAMLETHRHHRAKQAGWIRRWFSTGLTPLDAVLPHGGLPCGAVTEILSDQPGIGAMSLAMRIASRCGSSNDHGGAIEEVRSISEHPHGVSQSRDSILPTARNTKTEHDRAPATRSSSLQAQRFDVARDHRPVVVVDRAGDFYPPAALQYGLAIERIIVVRPRNDRDAFWSVDQSLRCPAIAAVVARLGPLDERLSRKLQLAADRSGCVGLLLMSAKQRTKSFAAVRMIVEGVAKNNTEWRMQNGDSVLKHSPSLASESYLCRITLLTVRDGVPAGPIWVDLHHETGSVPVHPLSNHRSAARAG